MKTLVPVILLLPLSVLAYEPGAPPPADFQMPKPLTLEDSLASFEVKEGWNLELVAAEPLVMDPIFIDWGEDRRLWVVEMADYPLGIDGQGKPGGRVRFLEDTTDDGKYDRSTVFLDGLNFPTGIKSWSRGVIVVAAPEIFYAADDDGDGKPDRREVLFRGFREGNQQHRVNGPWPGDDGWLYLANGDSGGTIESLKTGKKVELGNHDLRIRPDTGEMQLVTGRSQYGRTIDKRGNWFGCNNSRPLFHFVLEDRYLRRNPHVEYPNPVHQVPEDPHAPRVYPISEAVPRYNNPDSASHITSACGIAIRDDLAYICEPVHNLVHRQRLQPEGVTFTSVPADGEKEWLASRDLWFRPVQCRIDSDGSVWVVDMQRYVIEHPEWIPESWQKVLDLRAGHDRGRIYKLTHSHQTYASFPVKDSLALTPLNKAYSFGKREDSQAGEELARFALNASANRYLLAAAMTSLVPHLDTVVSFVTQNPDDPRLDALMHYLVATAVGTGNDIALTRLLNTGRFSAYSALFTALERKNTKLSETLRKKIETSGAVIEKAREMAKSGDPAGVLLLARRQSDRESDTDLLLELLAPNQPKAIQQAAVRRLLDLGKIELLLARWDTFLPGLRQFIFSVSLENRKLSASLLSAIESGKIDPLSINAANRDRLLRYPNGAIRDRAQNLFAELSQSNRGDVIEKFQPALELEGNAERGRETFALLCSACHEYKGVGSSLGADLNALTDRSPEALLTAILDPNRAVEDKFMLHQITLTDGRVLAGMIAGEVGDSIRIQLLDGNEETVPRSDIASLRNSGRSAMPEGLEAGLDPQKLADLIAFLRS